MLISSSQTTLSFPQSETVEVVFKENSNVSVNEIKASDTVAIIVLPESINILNMQPGSSSFLFSLAGDIVSECQADSEGNASLPLSAPGVYVIKTDTKTFKIIKK